MQWDTKNKVWKEDEWLTQIYQSLKDAKDAVYRFAEGRPFDNDRELQVTRYFGKSVSPLINGKELEKGDPNIVEHVWMRYAAYTLM